MSARPIVNLVFRPLEWRFQGKRKKKGLTVSSALLTDLTPKSIFHVVEPWKTPSLMGRRLLMESLDFGEKLIVSPLTFNYIHVHVKIYRKRKKFKIFRQKHLLPIVILNILWFQIFSGLSFEFTLISLPFFFLSLFNIYNYVDFPFCLS